jgi:nucleoside-diphosphate-sugar epimerase
MSMQRVQPEELEGQRVLVTGLTSFIGSHLIPELVKRGVQVVATAPDLGWRPWTRDLVTDGKITFVKADVLTPEGIDLITPYLASADHVVHLARVWAQGRTLLDLAVDEIARNLLGTIRFLSIAAQHVRGIVYPSSVEVYGAPESLLLNENHPLRPVSPYAVAKVSAEGFLQAYAAKSSIALTILRYATVYGPGELEPRAVPNFIRAALANESPSVDGNGLDVRDYVYIADVVEATVRTLVSSRKGTRIYNIGTGVGCSTKDLALLVMRLTGNLHELVYRTSGRVPTQVICDVSTARVELDLPPGSTLEQGLTSEIQWFRDNDALWRNA